MSLYLKSLIVLLSLTVTISCSNLSEDNNSCFNSQIPTEDFKVICKVVLDNFSRNDILFSEQEKCVFEAFVNNELSSVNPYFDRIVSGYRIKYYTSPIAGYSFCLIKDKNQSYHTVDNITIRWIDNFYRTEYVRESGFLVSPSNSLSIVTDLDSVLFSSLDDYLENVLISDKKDSSEVLNSFNMIGSLVNNLHQERSDINPAIFESCFKILKPEVLMNELIALKHGEKLNEYEIQMYKRLHKLMFYYFDKRAIVFKNNDFGIIAILLDYINDKINVNYEFIPMLRYNEMINESLSYKSSYPECH